MIEIIDARIEGFRRDNERYSQNLRDYELANENAQRVEEAREAREWVNNNEREWAELVEDFLSWSNEEQSNYRSGISDDQLAELNRRVGLRNELATQADNSQSSGPPEGGVNTDFITDSIDKLGELSSDLFNSIMEALNTGGTASEAAHAGEITGDDPYDFSDDGSPASGSGQTEGTDQTSGDAGCDGSGPDCDGGEAETQQTGGSAQTEGTAQTGGSDQTSGDGECDGSGPDCDGGEAETQQPDFSDVFDGILITPDP